MDHISRMKIFKANEYLVHKCLDMRCRKELRGQDQLVQVSVHKVEDEIKLVQMRRVTSISPSLSHFAINLECEH